MIWLIVWLLYSFTYFSYPFCLLHLAKFSGEEVTSKNIGTLIYPKRQAVKHMDIAQKEYALSIISPVELL